MSDPVNRWLNGDHCTPEETQVFYASILSDVRAAARECGYALAVHGSERRDFDLIAVPWVPDAKSEAELVKAVWIAACGHHHSSVQPSVRPHGRRSYVMHIGTKAYIDLSVMPRHTVAQVWRTGDSKRRLFEPMPAVWAQLCTDLHAWSPEQIAEPPDTFVHHLIHGTLCGLSLDDWIDNWHDGYGPEDISLREYLGMTPTQYVQMMRDKVDCLLGILLVHPSELADRVVARLNAST
jgi:hypothetical protein